MNDKELLELAAKGAGINLWWDGDSPKELVHHWSGNPEDGGEERDYPWNPLADDGDALRLAARLRLTVSWDRFDDSDYATATPPHTHQGYDCIVDQDPCAAARRAITCAAAEIGRAM